MAQKGKASPLECPTASGFLSWRTTTAELFFSVCHFAGCCPSKSGNSSFSSWSLSAIGLSDFLWQFLEANHSIVLQWCRFEASSRERSLHCSFSTTTSSVFPVVLHRLFSLPSLLPCHSVIPFCYSELTRELLNLLDCSAPPSIPPHENVVILFSVYNN